MPRRSPRSKRSPSPRRKPAPAAASPKMRKSDVAALMRLPPSECAGQMIRLTLHEWKSGQLAAASPRLARMPHRQAVAIGMSNARLACVSARRMTAAQAREFRANPLRNPLTGRAIKKGGLTHKVLHAAADLALREA